MTYEKLAEEVSWWLHGMPTKKVKRIIALIVDAILDEAKENRRVGIPGLGIFSRGTRKARYILNPRTGERMALPELVTLKFTAAKAAKERLA